MLLKSINEPWERQPGESSKAFNAFELYLKMGYKRSLKKVANSLGLKNPRHLYEWKNKYAWDSRIFSYENEQQRLKNAADIETYKSITEKQLSMATSLRQLLNIPLKVIVERTKADPKGIIEAVEDFKKLNTIDLFKFIIDSARFVDIVVKIERLAIGEPTEIIKEDYTSTEIFGNIVAGDENASKLLFELVKSISDSENSKPADNGSLLHAG